MKLISWLRLAMIVLVAWPFLVGAAAMAGAPSFTAFVALLPLLAAVIALIVRLDPLLAAQLAADERVRQGWQTMRNVLVAELALGGYMTFVPVQAKPMLLVQVALVLAILGLSQAGGAFFQLAPRIAWVALVVLTGSFFWHNLTPDARESVRREAAEAVNATPTPQPRNLPVSRPPIEAPTPPIPMPRPSTVPSEPRVLTENGTWVPLGTSIRLSRSGGSVTTEKQSLDGEVFVTVRITPAHGGATVSRAVVPGEFVTVGTGAEAVRLELLDVDWAVGQVFMRRVQMRSSDE